MINISYQVEFPRELYLAYCIALINIYLLKNISILNPVYKIIEVFKARVLIAESPRILKGRRFYLLLLVLKSVYVILLLFKAKARVLNVFYINNYINWD